MPQRFAQSSISEFSARFAACLSLCCAAALWCGTTLRAQEAFPPDVRSVEAVSVGHKADPAADAVGGVQGVVKDTSDVPVGNAVVTLAADSLPESIVKRSNEDGGFQFTGVGPGRYTLTVAMQGFETTVRSGVLQPGQELQVNDVALSVARVNMDVEVQASSRDVASAQLGFEEKQRVLGVFPNFYASYIWDAEPLTAGQKFALAWRFSTDPIAFSMAGAVAAGEQRAHGFEGYRQGIAGFSKRFGASYADGFTSTMLGQAILPAVFHQDPRYFVKGKGSKTGRALYAIAATVICRGDNRRWQLNYSNIVGNVASASLSNAYYPASNRNGAGLTVENSLLSTSFGALGNLMQEFFLHKMTPNVPEYGPDAVTR